MLTLVADATYPHLYRIRYPNGWTSRRGTCREQRTQPTVTPDICWGKTPSEAPQTGERQAA